MCLRSSQPQQCSIAKDFVKVFKNSEKCWEGMGGIIPSIRGASEARERIYLLKNIVFFASMHYQLKPSGDAALVQPLPQRLPGVGLLKSPKPCPP